MPTVNENHEMWNDKYDWADSGHQWSKAWGSAESQWSTTILRRIFPLLPTRSVLEIAPGFGRWTPYLIDATSQYVGIDISERAVAHCQRTYGPLGIRPRFLLGDGVTLRGVRDGDISFAFSFDSLVHVELDCISAYASELFRVLEPGGHAFIHHSNIGEYMVDGRLTIEQFGWRGKSVTAELAQKVFRSCGLRSIAHEKITWVWDTPFTDCFSLIRKPLNEDEAELGDTVFYNKAFSDELAHARFVHERYSVMRARSVLRAAPRPALELPAVAVRVEADVAAE